MFKFGFPNQTVDHEEMLFKEICYLSFYGKSYSCTKGMCLNLILAADKGSPAVHIGAIMPQTPGACPVLFLFIIAWNQDASSKIENFWRLFISH